MLRCIAEYVAGDLSGIQDYILGVRTVGKAQAKRLRARSFHVEIFEYAALATARDRLGITDASTSRCTLGRSPDSPAGWKPGQFDQYGHILTMVFLRHRRGWRDGPQHPLVRMPTRSPRFGFRHWPPTATGE